MAGTSSETAPDALLQQLSSLLQEVQQLTLSRYGSSSGALSLPTIADPKDLDRGIVYLSSELPSQGWGLEKTGSYLLDQVVPTLAPGQSGSRYFGFVTGGVLPIAALADNLVTLFDANVQVHLPKETLSTLIEDHTITLLLQLLSLPQDEFTGTITTGATTANILALTCAREQVMKRVMRRRRKVDAATSSDELDSEGDPEWSFAEEGFSEDTPPVNVFVALPHASIKKAAAVVGIGRKRVVDVGVKPVFSQHSNNNSSLPFLTDAEDVRESIKILEFDLASLEDRLKASQDAGQGSIVVAGMGEVNTGALTHQLPFLRALCDKYDAWLHVDAAFSAFVCLVPGHEWISEEMATCADSITSDAHKQLNVPYDAGLLFIRKHQQHPNANANADASLLEDVCGPGKGQKPPAYLKAADGGRVGEEEAEDDEDAKFNRAYAASLPSPLFKNLENSKRFRALPIYAALLSEGKDGIRSIVQRNIAFRRAIETWMRSGKLFQVLTPSSLSSSSSFNTHEPWSSPDWNTTILLFRPHPLTCPNQRFISDTSAFIDAVKATRKVYISPTTWHGVPAVRLAVSNWRTGLEGAQGGAKEGEIVENIEESEDYRVTVETLKSVMAA